MLGYFIDADLMNELWERLCETDLNDEAQIRDVLGFTKGILYPISLADYEEIKPNKEKMGEPQEGSDKE